MRRLGEDIQHFTDAVRLRIGKVETLSVETPLVREIVHRVGDEVDRDDVDASTLDAYCRHPRRKHIAQPLYQLEEIVGPVDLVDIAGLRVADHKCRTIDAPGALALLAHNALGQMLGAKIRVVQFFRFLEHVLAERSFIKTGSGDRACVMEAAGFYCLGELDCATRAVDIG